MNASEVHNAIPQKKSHTRPVEFPHSDGDTVGFAIQSHRSLWLLVLGTLLPLSLIFAPISFWPLSFVCLVPWLILIGASAQAPRVYFYSYVLGLSFFLINMRWLYPATGLGYIALAAYLGAYFPAVACPLRHVVRRRRVPLGLVVPIVWVGSEMLRAVVISGFPWFFLSHSVYEVLTLIQISDLVGAYGVSFVIAAINGAIADVVLARVAAKTAAGEGLHRRQARFSITLAVVLLVGTVAYGQFQLRRDTSQEGPTVAVLQGDYVSLVAGDEVNNATKMRHYLEMLEASAAESPDIYLLPETPWIMYLNPDARDFFPISRQSFAALRKHAVDRDAYVVTGSASLVLTPFDLVETERRYNSATVFSPDGSEPGRYDKVHVVPFGEAVPFRYGRLRDLYFLLNRLMPFSGPDGDYEYSLFPGDGFQVFTMTAASKPGTEFRFGIPICYEDVMPYVAREFARGEGEKRVDFLLNISNDGWFGRGVQQPQHLAICAFRAVENRVGIARAVNTGISGFVKPSGQLHDLVTGDSSRRWPGIGGYSVAPLMVDSRYTYYSKHGDWFAWSCAVLWLAFFLDYWVVRVRTADA